MLKLLLLLSSLFRFTSPLSSKHLRRASFALAKTTLSCKTHDTCQQCSRAAGCGFCGSTEKCMEGNEKGPISPTGCLSKWRMVECNDIPPCSSFESCPECLISPRCGWCASTEEQADKVRCVAMKWSAAAAAEGVDEGSSKKPQWMPPQNTGWCPGGTYQHTYQQQCTATQPSLKEARILGTFRQNTERAAQYTAQLIQLGNNAKKQLTLLLQNVHAAKNRLQKQVQDSINQQSSAARQHFYASSNETLILTTETEAAFNAYTLQNTTYYTLLAEASTPGTHCQRQHCINNVLL